MLNVGAFYRDHARRSIARHGEGDETLPSLAEVAAELAGTLIALLTIAAAIELALVGLGIEPAG